MISGLTMAAVAILCASVEDVQCTATWAERAFSEMTRPALSGSITVLHEDSPGDTKLGRCAAGVPLRLGEKNYKHGIGVNAHTALHVTLPKPGKFFLADIGLDRNVDNSPASVRFHVEGNGRSLYSTEIMRPNDPPVAIKIPLEGTREFDLIVDNGGDSRAFDQADWGEARVILDNSEQIYIDTLGRSEEAEAQFPFSFEYGGRPSPTFLSSWDCRLEVESADGGQRRSLTLTDPETQMEVRAIATVFSDSPGVDWTLYFTNRGVSDTPIITNVRALDAAFLCPPGKPAIFHSLRSTGGVDDWLPFDIPLPPGQRHAFAPNAGRSSLGAFPFFTVQWEGGGAVVGIGWTGQWAASVENRDGLIGIQAGMQNLHLMLHPGESIRTPRILLMRWSGDEETKACNLWRSTMLRHISPKIQGKTVVPPIAHLSTAFYEMDQCTDTGALVHLNAGKDLGFECYWYDAYYGKDNFPTVGNYVLPIERGFNGTRFPNQLQPIADAVHRAGLDFLMWFEPERICPGTLMAREHPEWVVFPDDGGWGMFNLGIPVARQYITEYIGALIEAYGLKWVRIDNAVSYAPLWKKLDAAAGPDRIGMAEIRYVEGLYRWWDDMRAAHPEIAIDNCASGGGRIDLELCSRSIPLWRTDATIGPLLNKDFHQAALQNQVMTAGLSRYVPFNASGQMGADPYDFRSGFNGGISFCEDTRPETYPRPLLRDAIIEGKRIRKYYFGNLYSLTDVSTNPTDWCVLQYHRTTEQDGMVIAFRRHQSPYTGFRCALLEIDAQANYEVTLSTGYHATTNIVIPGNDLRMFELHIDETPGSILLEYRRVPQ